MPTVSLQLKDKNTKGKTAIRGIISDGRKVHICVYSGVSIKPKHWVNGIVHSSDPLAIAKNKLLKEFKGIGDVGVDIFFREAQTAWDELYPFLDDKAQDAAKKLDLPTDAEALVKLSDRSEFPKLVAALVRVDLDDAYDQVANTAKASS